MLQVPRRVVGLVLANSHRCISALTSTLYSACGADKVKEAPLLDNNVFMALPEEARERNNLETTIFVPAMVDLTPVNGLPDDRMSPRRARIFQPHKNAMQSGTMNIQHWEVEFDNKQRWQNANMGWSSSGDPLSFLKIRFSGMCEAIEFCMKNGWNYYVDVPRPERGYRIQNSSFNFSWNKRTRVSTK